MRTLAVILAALTLAAPQVAAAAEPPCLTAREASSVVTWAMPSAITGITQRCTPVLAKDAYLARSGTQLAQRYGAARTAAWPEAKAALLRVAGESKDPMMSTVKDLPDATIQQLLDTLVSGVVSEKVPTERCGTISRALDLLSPLPPENTAEIVALTLGLAAHTDNPRVGKFAICKA